jgi:folate-binding protein YgfZ
MTSVVPDMMYEAARTRSLLTTRTDLAVTRIFGRDPARMVQGLISNDILSQPVGGAVYATLLTPKGRMLADLRVIRRTEDLLLVSDIAAAENVRATLKRFVPPLFAKAEDARESIRVFGLCGPHSLDALAGVLARASSGGADGTALRDLAPDAGIQASFRDSPVYIVRDADFGVDGWLLIAAVDVADGLYAALGGGSEGGDLSVLDVLRIESGTPRWGHELGDDVIPLEANLKERAISTTKGCYTGQEVIIRILHRGHVNRRLLGLRLGTLPPPSPGVELFTAEGMKPVARITSSCVSPALGQTIALAYVRREVDVGATLHAGAPDGAAAIVAPLPFVPSTT